MLIHNVFERITMMQLSDLPSKKFSMNDSTNRTFLMNQLDNLLPMPGSSILSQEKFMFTLKVTILLLLINL